MEQFLEGFQYRHKLVEAHIRSDLNNPVNEDEIFESKNQGYAETAQIFEREHTKYLKARGIDPASFKSLLALYHDEAFDTLEQLPEKLQTNKFYGAVDYRDHYLVTDESILKAHSRLCGTAEFFRQKIGSPEFSQYSQEREDALTAKLVSVTGVMARSFDQEMLGSKTAPYKPLTPAQRTRISDKLKNRIGQRIAPAGQTIEEISVLYNGELGNLGPKRAIITEFKGNAKIDANSYL